MSLRPSRTMSVLGSVLGSVVVALGATTAGLVAVAPAATAATCSGAGVSVVVDFKGLGGGQQTGCVTGKGGSSAATILGAAGVELTRARNQPGFVCRVQQVPASDPCVNASPSDAYWSLWWSDGSSGSWSYASLGVDNLKIPEGGSVGFAWDDQDGQVQPGTAPPKAPAASPSPSPSSQGGQSAQGGGTSPTAPAPTAGSASAGAAAEEQSADGPDQQQRGDRAARAEKVEKAEKERRKSEKQEKADRADQDAEADQDADAETGEQDTVVDLDGTEPTTAPVDDPAGLPVWVAPAVLGLLAAALAGLAVVRRRRRG